MSVSAMQRHIEGEIGAAFQTLGLVPVRPGLCWSCREERTLMAEVVFLSRSQADYFGTSTASFGIEFGGFYGSLDALRETKGFPAACFCQVRGSLWRDYAQAAPLADLPAPEHKRRDLWWVNGGGESLPRAVDSAVRVVKGELPRWLSRLEDYKSLAWRLLLRGESPQGLWGFGAKGSPARRTLQRVILPFLPPQSLIAWLTRRVVRI